MDLKFVSIKERWGTFLLERRKTVEIRCQDRDERKISSAVLVLIFEMEGTKIIVRSFRRKKNEPISGDLLLFLQSHGIIWYVRWLLTSFKIFIKKKNIFFILWSFLSTCSDFKWLKLPAWFHVRGRGHKFPSVAPSLPLWPCKWQLQAGQKGPIIPLDLSGYDLSHVLQWLKPRQWRRASVKPCFFRGDCCCRGQVWIPCVAMGVCCFFHRKEAGMRHFGL